MNNDLLNSSTDHIKTLNENILNQKNYYFNKDNFILPSLSNIGMMHNDGLDYLLNKIKSKQIFKNVNYKDYNLFLIKEISEYIGARSEYKINTNDMYNALSVTHEIIENMPLGIRLAVLPYSKNSILLNSTISNILNLPNKYDPKTFEYEANSLMNNSLSQLNYTERLTLQGMTNLAIYSYHYWNTNLSIWLNEYKKYNNINNINNSDYNIVGAVANSDVFPPMGVITIFSVALSGPVAWLGNSLYCSARTLSYFF